MKSIRIKFKRGDTRSQASATHLLESLSGKPISPTCQACGGVLSGDGPSNGKCRCAAPAAKVGAAVNVKQIVEERLRKDGFAGLYCAGCGCRVGDLMPCGEPGVGCKPGYIRYGSFECTDNDWLIVEPETEKGVQP